MVNSNKFKYRRYWIRGIIAAIIAIIIHPIKDALLSNLIKDDTYFSFSLSITVVFLLGYYIITRKYFLNEGNYVFGDDSIDIHMNNRSHLIKLTDIKKVIYLKRSIFNEKYVLLTITNKRRKTIRIVSEAIESDYDISRYSLYEIYKFIAKNCEELKEADYSDSECFVLE